MNQQAKALNKIYYNPKNRAGFSSQFKLYLEAKKQLPTLTLEQVKNWWKTQNIPSRFALRRKKFSRALFITGAANNTWLADLADFTKLAKYNRGYKWMLIIEDLFSRKLKALIPQKSKTAKETATSLENVFAREKTTPKKFLTDQVCTHVKVTFFLNIVIDFFRAESLRGNVPRFLKNMESKIIQQTIFPKR